VVRPTSSWLAIDIETKRPKKMEGVEAEKFTQLRHKNAIPHQSAKLPDYDLQKFRNIFPTFFDFDLNHHVTSTRYIDWMMDAIPLDFHKSNFPKSMTINYVKETLPEQGIQLFYEKVNSDKYVFVGKHSDKQSVAVKAEIEFSKY
jgi:acyl-ACP thioesterase